MEGRVKILLIVLLVLAFLLGIVVGYYLAGRISPPTGSGSTPPVGRGCTLEAKICPDGSAVGRTGPNCEFAPCP